MTLDKSILQSICCRICSSRWVCTVGILFVLQLQQLVDRTIVQADKDGDGMISFEEFREVWTTESKI